MSLKDELILGFYFAERRTNRPAQSDIKQADNKAAHRLFTTRRVKCILNILGRGEEIAREVKGW